MRKLIPLLLLLASAFSLSAQETFSLRKAIEQSGSHQQCGQPALRAWAMQNNPEFARKWAELENFTQEFAQQSESRAVLTVPVVVHVIYRNATQNISLAQINSQIDVLNDDFRRLNADAGQTPSQWQNIASDTEIEFCLAGIDPNGNATTGITRTSTNTPEIGDGAYYSTSQGGKDAWNTNKYLNIWVCEIEAQGDLLGFAFPPGAAPANEDGVVMDYRYFGTTGTVLAPLDGGRTCTHEVGHYFNLEHIWGLNGGCNDDDFVSDTPDQDAEYYGCPSSGSSCGSSDMNMNYMDYVDDGCMNLFTTGQKTRMVAALNGPRSGLLSTGACVATSRSPEIGLAQISLYPNPVRDQLHFEIPARHATALGVDLYSPTGKRLTGTEIPAGSTHFSWEIEALPTGLYFLQIQSAGKQVTHKIIVQ